MLQNLFLPLGTFSIVLFIYICIVFALAQIRRDNSVMDIAYGPAFFVSALITLWWNGLQTPTVYLVVGLMGIWSTRLALRIYRKNHNKPEDARYAAWRTAWMKQGAFYFLLRSFLQINLLQGVIIGLVATPFIIAASSNETVPALFQLIGIGVFIFGITFESIADFQLDRFLARKRAGTESAPLMTTGLFRYARRPNYFGETLIWWGLAIIVLPLPFGYLAIISPLLITYIVTKVTGPMLEDIFLKKYPAEYREYMRTTNYFIPWFPRT
jgi:steroid 5-alpha reductase family enzyme